MSAHTIEARPLGRLARTASYSIDAAVSTARLITRRVHRTREVVEAEYHDGHWRRLLASREWERRPDLRSFLIGDSSHLRNCKIDGHIVRVPTREYYRYRLDAFPALIASLTGDAPAIVELGAGYGYNLFSLALRGRFERYVGLDISDNGLQVGRLIAQHYGLTDRMTFERLDLTDPAHPGFASVTGRVGFTYFCIEQMPRSVETVVANLIAARPRRIIHVEPTTELLNLGRPRDLVSFLYIKSVNYQTRLFHHLDDLEKQGAIRVLKRMRMPFAPTIHNDGFLFAWEPLS